MLILGFQGDAFWIERSRLWVFRTALAEKGFQILSDFFVNEHIRSVEHELPPCLPCLDVRLTHLLDEWIAVLYEPVEIEGVLHTQTGKRPRFDDAACPAEDHEADKVRGGPGNERVRHPVGTRQPAAADWYLQS
jgi:hypothetical protein